MRLAAGQILGGGEGRAAGQVVIGKRRFILPGKFLGARPQEERARLMASALMAESRVRMEPAKSPASNWAPPRSVSATGTEGCGPSARSKVGCAHCASISRSRSCNR